MSEELKPDAYIVTRYQMHAPDDYSECEVAYTAEEFEALDDKQKLIDTSHAAPLFHIPPGYKLVPVEPTDEMLFAWLKSETDQGGMFDHAIAYKAMLKSAP